MRLFIIKILLFITVIVSVNQVILFVAPYWWGNNMLREKMPYFYENQDKYNTVFLGSSRIFRHVIPNTFDSFVNKRGYDMRSFNLGTAGAANPETFYILRKLLKQENLLINTIFVEIVHNMPIDDINYHTSRVVYNMDIESLISSYRIHRDSKFIKEKLHKRLFVTFAERLMLISYMQDLISAIFDKPSENEYTVNDGYLKKSSVSAREAFLKNPKVLDRRIKRIKQNFKKLKSSKEYYNQSYLDYIKDLQILAKEKNVELIFVLTPRNHNRDCFFTFQHIDSNKKIDLNSVNKYPKFYSEKYTYDVGHLNHKGAKLFSKVLAQEYVKMKRRERKKKEKD